MEPVHPVMTSRASGLGRAPWEIRVAVPMETRVPERPGVSPKSLSLVGPDLGGDQEGLTCLLLPKMHLGYPWWYGGDFKVEYI